MICLNVIYPNQPESWFKFDYYINSHLPLVLEVLPALEKQPPNGVPRIDISRGLPGLDGSPPPYVCLARIWMNKPEDFLVLIAHEAAMTDLVNFTNLTPAAFLTEPCA